jgi:hypothetical protein
LGGHDAVRPAGDAAVEAAALGHRYLQAAVVIRVVAGPRCPRYVALEHGPGELIRRHRRHTGPVPGSGLYVRGFVDQYAVAEALSRYSGMVEEPEEELDQGRVAVDEADLLVDSVRLALCPFAPVGDRAGEDDLAIRQLPDLGCRSSADGRSRGLPDRMLSGPVTLDTLSGPTPRFCVAWPGPLWRQRLVAEELGERAVADEPEGLLDLAA